MLKKISYWFVVQVISAALKCFIIMFCHTVYLNRNVFKNQKTEGAAHFQLTKRDRIAQLSLLKDRTSVALNIIPNRLYEHTEYNLLTNTSGFSVELLLQRLTPTVFYIQVFFFFFTGLVGSLSDYMQLPLEPQKASYYSFHTCSRALKDP